MEEFLGIALRVTLMYFYAMAILGIAGKRSLRSLAPHDFVLTIIVGDMFDDVFWSEVSVAKGVTGLGVLIFLHVLTAYVTYRSSAIDRILEGRAEPVIKHGRFIQAALRKERVHKEEVLSDLRLLAIESAQEAKVVHMETNGRFSVLRKEGEKPAQKSDLPRLEELLS